MVSINGEANAQTSVSPSLVESILVVGERSQPGARSIDTQFSIDEAAVRDVDAASADEILRFLPGAHLPTNSRGETIVFLRNAGERQVSVFFDGASINVPWDNRLDLSMFPSGAIGSVQTAQGPLSPHYGVNALGAINLVPRQAPSQDAVMELRLEAGKVKEHLVEASLRAGTRDSELLLGWGMSHRAGEPVSEDADLPFFQADPRLRANTDRDILDIYGRVKRKFIAGEVAVTVLYVDAEKGVAPESDRRSGNRFWRYPELTHFLTVANAKFALADQTSASAAVWVQDFRQTIDQFETNSYEAIDLRERDIDRTIGARTLATHSWGRNKIVLSANYLESLHRQRDFDFAGGLPPATPPPELRFSQRNYSVGGEFERALADELVIDLAVGYDWVDYLRTGDKPSIQGVSEFTARAGAIWNFSDGWSVKGAVGRKARAPTMRELFGQALNRFLINPDLTPETILTAELGIDWRSDDCGVSIVPFIQEVRDTIDQRNVGLLRQRINLRGSRVKGLEVTAWRTMGAHWRVDADAIYSDVDRKQSAPTDPTRIAEKPNLLANVRLEYRGSQGFGFRVEGEHVGRAFSVSPTGALVRLATSTQLNLRTSYRFQRPTGDEAVEVYIRLDNVTDAYVEPQAGLPAPGRWLRGGLRVDW